MIAFIGFALIAAFFLLTEHRAHFFGVVPYLFVLLCPLLHFVGHQGHGRQQQQQRHDESGHHL